MKFTITIFAILLSLQSFYSQEALTEKAIEQEAVELLENYNAKIAFSTIDNSKDYVRKNYYTQDSILVKIIDTHKDNSIVGEITTLYNANTHCILETISDPNNTTWLVAIWKYNTNNIVLEKKAFSMKSIFKTIYSEGKATTYNRKGKIVKSENRARRKKPYVNP